MEGGHIHSMANLLVYETDHFVEIDYMLLLRGALRNYVTEVRRKIACQDDSLEMWVGTDNNAEVALSA